MMTEVEEAAPLAKPEVEPRDHSGTKAGAGLVFFVAFAVFVAARLSAKWVIPRGKRYEVTTVLGPKVELIAASPRTGQHHQEDSLQSLSQLQLADEIPADTNQDNDNEASSMALVDTTTEKCTGNQNLPVVRGVDFVAFRSLATGQPAVYGSGEHSTKFNDYLFFFRSEENKLAFENDPAYYIPAWGGFCSYGIAHEVVENVGILGPAADPGHWWIEDEVLYLFRSSALREEFIRDAEPNIDNGWAMWREWFGDNEKTLFNTACF